MPMDDNIKGNVDKCEIILVTCQKYPDTKMLVSMIPQTNM